MNKLVSVGVYRA